MDKKGYTVNLSQDKINVNMKQQFEEQTTAWKISGSCY